LPIIEKKNITIIATTTENPYFNIIPALRSRMHILELNSLNVDDIAKGLKKIVKNKIIDIKITEKLIKKIALISNGDFRYAINSLNLIKKLYGERKITESIIKNVLSSSHFYSDKKSDGHFDLLSAFHKSLRGSDIDASLYYLALLIKSGDFIGMERRIIMATYEDVGLANPNLTLRVTSALENVKKIGFPEAGIILTYIVIEICKSNKSNATVIARNNAMNLIKKRGVFEIPKHLKDGHYKNAKELGNGIGYKYPHNYGGYVKQQYMPNEIKNEKIFKKNKNDKI
jgi:putative ATPase